MAYSGRSGGVARLRGFHVSSRPECLQWMLVGCEIPAAEATGRPTLAWEAHTYDQGMVRVTAPWVRHGFGVAWESQRVDTSKLPSYRGPARTPYTNRYLRIAFPHWLVILTAAAMPAYRARLYLRTRRRAAQNECCTTCGYDLRATPDRCPEGGKSREPS